MPGTIKFAYRALFDVVIAEVDWTVDSEQDLAAWYDEYRTYFTTRFRRKVDLILELSKFHIHPKVATLFGEYRARVLSEFTTRSYRVNQSKLERTYMYTSSTLHRAPANHYETLQEAIAALLKDRGGPSPG
jgi:hypothetical protein